MHEVSPLRGSHHTSVRPTGVDTPACVVAAPMGLGTYASCGDMHTHCGTWEPRRGDHNTGTGVNPCVHSVDTVQNPEGVARIHERPHVPPLHHFPDVREMVLSVGNHPLGIDYKNLLDNQTGFCWIWQEIIISDIWRQMSAIISKIHHRHLKCLFSRGTRKNP